jgi:hypothetical protein
LQQQQSRQQQSQQYHHHQHHQQQQEQWPMDLSAHESMPDAALDEVRPHSQRRVTTTDSMLKHKRSS